MRKVLLAGVLAIAALTSVPANAACTDGKNRWIRVVNHSSWTISELNVTNTHNDDWGPNILLRIIHPEHRLSVDADDGSCRCPMDVRAVSSDGTTNWIIRGYDVCSETDFELIDSDEDDDDD